MVREALTPYKLEPTAVERIRGVIVTNKSTSKVTEPTHSEHDKNEPDHPHYAPLLEIAVVLWNQCKKLGRDKLKSNEIKNIFTLINKKPDGGRPGEGDQVKKT